MALEGEGHLGYVWVMSVILTFITLTQLIYCEIVIPPILTVRPSPDEFFVLHQDITLTCQASGHPTPRFHWTKDGVSLDMGSHRYEIRDGNLRIKKATSDDSGVYHCWASNYGGTDRSGPAKRTLGFLKPFPRRDHDIRMVNRGDSVTLTCRPPESQPPPVVAWSKNADDNVMAPVELSDRIITDLEGDLHILNFHRDDAEVYTCSVFNTFIRAHVRDSPIPLSLDQDSPPRNREVSVIWRSRGILTELVGSTLKLQCIFDGYPPPVISWEKIGTPLPAGRWKTTSWDTTLEIEKLEPSDAGRYECVAFSEISLQPITARMQIIVQAAPEFITVPISTNVTSGESVTLECGATGTPMPNITWLSNWRLTVDSRFSVTEQSKDDTMFSTLHVTNALLGDTMVIGCTANNKHGQVYTSSYLSVIDNAHEVASIGVISTSFDRWTLIYTVSGVLLICPWL